MFMDDADDAVLTLSHEATPTTVNKENVTFERVIIAAAGSQVAEVAGWRTDSGCHRVIMVVSFGIGARLFIRGGGII